MPTLAEIGALKAGPSWVKLNLRKWKRLMGFTDGFDLPNTATETKTDKESERHTQTETHKQT